MSNFGYRVLGFGNRASGADAPLSEVTMWGWGRRDGGQLNNSVTAPNISSPVQIASGEQWHALSSGSSQAFAVKIDGTLWAWGGASFGALGNGTTSPTQSSPVQVGTDTDWVTPFGGAFIGRCTKRDGTLWSWGWNAFGQVGNLSGSNVSTPVQIGSDTDWNDRIVICTEGGEAEHCLSIKADGTLWGWGRNAEGELGSGTTTSPSSPVQIGAATDWEVAAACNLNSYFIRNGGRLWSTGTNTDFGIGSGGASRSTAIQIKTGITNFTNTSGGLKHGVAVRASGQIYSWGRNFAGQLGIGNLINRSTPVQVGGLTSWADVNAHASRSYFTRATGAVWGAGNNFAGQLGTGNSTTPISSPVVCLGGNTDFIVKTGGNNHHTGFKIL